MNRARYLGVQSVDGTQVALRAIPAPFRAMLAICSDLDETPDHETYLQISRFLNTGEKTRIGRGVELEVGNTMYFDMAPGEFSFWNTSESNREQLLSLMRSGHIDCIHSFGDSASRREHAVRALDTLSSAGCTLRVWIDHATAPTNFGADIMQGQGDEPGAAAYHADLTVAHGVDYVWRGRVTSIIGQGVQRHLRGVLDWRHPAKSLLAAAKEAAKGLSGRQPGSRYTPHARNDILWPVELRDGQSVFEFLRCDPHPHGISVGDRGDRIHEVLSDRMLDALVDREATSILYTHLGKTDGHGTILPLQSIEAFRRLARRQDEGDVLIATTARVLDYHRVLRDLEWHARSKEVLEIHLSTNGFPCDGISFDIRPGSRVRVFADGIEREDALISALPDQSGVTVQMPWSALSYPL